jgi:hypothetical protein
MTEIELVAWADPADTRPRTWLLMGRWMADRLCPGAAEDRESWQLGVERDAEAAAHTDNLVPVNMIGWPSLPRLVPVTCPFL